MGKTPSLVRQIDLMLNSMVCAGQSKHTAKAESETPNHLEGIYSYQTLRSYLKQCCEFASWAKAQHGGKYLSDIRAHVPEYLRMRIAAGVSPYTVRLDASAFSKLYQCSSRDWGVVLPRRERVNITRSRGPRKHDAEFSESRNAAAVGFCKGTGLRKHELVALLPQNIASDGSSVTVIKGKGGKTRTVPVLPIFQAHVAAMREGAIAEGRDRVFMRSEVKNRMDEHGYRREYAQALYTLFESSGLNVTNTRYHCRKDKSGISYDRGVMAAVSQALGHSRIDVIAGSYL